MKLKEIRSLSKADDIHAGYAGASTGIERALFRMLHRGILNPKSMNDFYGRQVDDLKSDLQNQKNAVMLLGNTIHDKKNSFRAIRMHLESSKFPGVSPDSVNEFHASAIRIASENASSSMDDVDFVKLVNGEGKKEPDEVVLSDLEAKIRSKADQYRLSMGEKNLDVGLVFRFNKNIEKYSIVGGRAIVQIADNLISNAFKYTDKLVSLRAEDTGTSLKFTVEDDGSGIPECERKAVFDPSLESVTQRTHGSSHFGLPSSAVICEALNWKLHFESEVGKGTTFHLSIPIVKAEPSQQQ